MPEGLAPGTAGTAPEVTRGFDPPDGPYRPGHRGVDLAAGPGTPVLAAGAGVVGYAGVLAGRGVVTVVHPGDGLRTTYEPVHPPGTTRPARVRRRPPRDFGARASGLPTAGVPALGPA